MWLKEASDTRIKWFPPFNLQLYTFPIKARKPQCSSGNSNEHWLVKQNSLLSSPPQCSTVPQAHCYVKQETSEGRGSERGGTNNWKQAPFVHDERLHPTLLRHYMTIARRARMVVCAVRVSVELWVKHQINPTPSTLFEEPPQLITWWHIFGDWDYNPILWLVDSTWSPSGHIEIMITAFWLVDTTLQIGGSSQSMWKELVFCNSRKIVKCNAETS